MDEKTIDEKFSLLKFCVDTAQQNAEITPEDAEQLFGFLTWLEYEND